MIIFFISSVSEGVPLRPGQNLVRDEAGLRQLLTPLMHVTEVPRDTLPGTAVACETGFQQGPQLPPRDTLGGRQGGKGPQRWLFSLGGDAGSAFLHSEGV